MKRKVLALLLSMALVCSSTMITVAAEGGSDGENPTEESSEETNIEVDNTKNAEKTESENDETDLSGDKTEKDGGEDQKESAEDILENVTETSGKFDENESDTELTDEGGARESAHASVLRKVSAISVLSDTTSAEDDLDFEAVDANGDNYWDSDVELINSLIENNGLDWEENEPEQWDEMSGGGVRWETVDVSGLSRISGLVISNEGVTGNIDLSGLERLTYLDCSGNELSGLNVQGCERLEELYCSNNKLTELNLEELSKLCRLETENNALVKLVLNGNVSLEWIGCASNLLKELNLDDLPELSILDCSENKLTELNVSGTPKLSGLYCSGNNLSKLDVSVFENLETLECNENRLTELNVTGLTDLTRLECRDNLLSEVDLSDLKALEYLNCNGNDLTDLNLSGLSKLGIAFGENGSTTSICGNNPLKTLTLPAGNTITFESSDGGYIDVRINPLYASCGQSKEDTVIGFRPVAESGYEFKSWNDLPENVDDSGWWSSPYDGEAVDGWVFVDKGENITISANFGPISKYSIIDGAGSSWTEDTTGSITMRADGEFDKFQSVQVDGVTVDPTYYTAQQGSTIITLKPEFLQTLAAGTHTLAILFTDGAASADFTVKEVQEENPGNQSGEGQNPGEDTKPGEGQQPGEESKPGEGQQSGEESKPGDEQQNTETNEGNNGQQISGIDKNGNGGQNAGQSGNKTNTTVTKAEKTQEVSKAVKTGDESKVVMFAVVMIVALMVCVVTGGIKIKKRH